MPTIFNKYYPLRNLIFCAGEGLWIFATFCLVHYFLEGSYLFFYYFPDHLLQALIITFIFQLCLYFYDLYDLSHGLTLGDTATRMTQAFGLGCIVLGATYYTLPILTTSIRAFWPGYFAVCCIILTWRWAYYKVLKGRLFVQNLLVLGTGEMATDIAREVEGVHDSAYRIVSFMGDTEPAFNPNHAPVQKEIPDIVIYCRSENIETIILALDDRRKKTPSKELLRCKLNGINIQHGIGFYEGITGKLMVEKVDPSGIFFSDGFSLSRSLRMVKRLLDIILASVGLILSLPITILSAIIIKYESPGPIFYLQERVGQREKPFMVIKFRSMRQDAEKDGAVWASQNDTRVTRFGGFIRKVRIDELPQMWNVLKGEMSFVGPRPERPIFVRQLEEKIPYYSIRHYIKPGITGWAQVYYPYGASEEDSLRKLEYDLYYMKHISLGLDLFVIFKTIKTVLFRKGSR